MPPPHYLIRLNVLVLFALLTTCTIYGQRSTCSEPIFPFDDIPQTVLCEELGEIQFDFYIGAGTPYTHSSQITAIPSLEIRIVGDFIIDNNFTFASAVIMIDPNVSIVINEESKLTLDNSKLFACEELWNGIILNNFSEVTTKNNTVIEDAKTAIQSWDKIYTFLDIENTIFNRNKVGISLKNPNMLPHGPAVINFKNNTFSCDAPLNGTFTDITFAGIELENIQFFVKGLPFSKNFFVGLENGIYSNGISNVSVSYFDFENIQNNGIFQENTNLIATNCIFTQCINKSINATKIRKLDLKNCNFFTDFGGGSFDVLGVFGNDFELNSDISIQKCIFNFTRIGNISNIPNIGIYLKSGLVSTGVTIHLFDNDFTFNTNNGTCIRIEGDYNNASSIRVERNEFLDCLRLGEFIRINDGDKSNLAIISNTIDGNNLWIGGTATTPQRGFVLEGSASGSNNEVSSNRFLRDFTDLTSSIANSDLGVRGEMFSNTKYCDNSFADVARQMEFRGLNLGTKLNSNNFLGGSRAFTLDGIIGPQGIEAGSHNGNTWQSFFVPPVIIEPGMHAECLSGNCNLSPFFSNTPQAPSSITPITFPTNIFPNDWFRFDALGTSRPTCVTELTGDDPANVLYNAIASEELNEEVGLVWEAEMYLYNKIKDGELSIGSSSLFSSFKEEKSSTNLEKFYNISKKLSIAYENELLSNDLENYKDQKSLIELELENLEDAILNSGISEDRKINKGNLLNDYAIINFDIENVYVDYKLHLQEHMSLIFSENEQIDANEIFENNRKQVNRIIINSILNNDGELLEDDMNDLLAVAIQCPQIGGMSVYKARGFLPICVRSEYEEIFGQCFPDSQIEERLIKKDLQDMENKAQKIKIYPNPASKNIYISHRNNGNGVVKLIDSIGRLCFTKEISGNNIEIEIDLPKGLYFLSINWDNGNIDREQLVVQ